MKTLWKTAYAAARLALQTGSDDGYYPGPVFQFAHGSKSERKAINRALEIMRDGKEDPMKYRKPGRILTRLRNRQRSIGPPTLPQYNCRCAVTAINDSIIGLLTQRPSIERIFGSIADPSMGPGLATFRASYAETVAAHRHKHEELLASSEGRSVRYEWKMVQDDSTRERVGAPAQTLHQFWSEEKEAKKDE